MPIQPQAAEGRHKGFQVAMEVSVTKEPALCNSLGYNTKSTILSASALPTVQVDVGRVFQRNKTNPLNSNGVSLNTNFSQSFQE